MIVKNQSTLIVILSLIILLGYLYNYINTNTNTNKKVEKFSTLESLTDTSGHFLFNRNQEVVNEVSRPTRLVTLDLCDVNSSDPDSNKNTALNVSRGFNTLYMNHLNNNVKKYIDNYVTLNILADRVKNINERLERNLHKNKQYNANGDLNFI